MTKSRQLSSMGFNSFTITKIHHDWDLRTVQWRIDVLQEYVRNHKLKENECHIFINRNRNRSRWIVVWKETPFLIMAPAGYKADHMVAMKVAADCAVNDKIRDELLNEITTLE